MPYGSDELTKFVKMQVKHKENTCPICYEELYGKKSRLSTDKKVSRKNGHDTPKDLNSLV